MKVAGEKGKGDESVKGEERGPSSDAQVKKGEGRAISEERKEEAGGVDTKGGDERGVAHTEGEGAKREQEEGRRLYLVKWKNKSYIHCTW